MMSRNRQSDVDRSQAVADHQANMRAEAEMALLREQELRALAGLLERALARLDRLEGEGKADAARPS
jgi:uncharacterized membrane protein